MINLEIIPEEIGLGVLGNGNAGVYGFDKTSQMMVTISFTPEAWKRFLLQAPRLRGVGIGLGGGVVDLSAVKSDGETH